MTTNPTKEPIAFIPNPKKGSKQFEYPTEQWKELGIEPYQPLDKIPTIIAKSTPKKVIPAQPKLPNVGQNSNWHDPEVKFKNAGQVKLEENEEDNEQPEINIPVKPIENISVEEPASDNLQFNLSDNFTYLIIGNNQVLATLNNKSEIEETLEKWILDSNSGYTLENLIVLKKLTLKVGVLVED